MKVEEQVCSVTQSKQLSQLGVTATPSFYWKECAIPTKDKPSFQLVLADQLEHKGSERYFPAYSVAELGLLLPAEITHEDEDLYLQGNIGNRKGEFFHIWFQSSIDNAEWDLFPAIEQDTEALARADALIWLLENSYINPSHLQL